MTGCAVPCVAELRNRPLPGGTGRRFLQPELSWVDYDIA